MWQSSSQNKRRKIPVCYQVILGLCCIVNLRCGESGNTSQSVIHTGEERVAVGLMSTVLPGNTLEETKVLLESRGRQEFTVNIAKVVYELRSYRLDIGKYGFTFWIVFKDNILQKVIRPIPRKIQKSLRRGVMVERMLPFSASDDSRIKSVLDAEGLTADEITTLTNKYKLQQEGLRSNNASPAFLFSGAAKTVLPRARADYKKNRKLMDRYNVDKIRLGMTEVMIDQIMGKPQHLASLSETEMIRIYGEDVDLLVNPRHLFSWIAVSFKNGVATRILSNSFLNPAWKKGKNIVEG